MQVQHSLGFLLNGLSLQSCNRAVGFHVLNTVGQTTNLCFGWVFDVLKNNLPCDVENWGQAFYVLDSKECFIQEFFHSKWLEL